MLAILKIVPLCRGFLLGVIILSGNLLLHLSKDLLLNYLYLVLFRILTANITLSIVTFGTVLISSGVAGIFIWWYFYILHLVHTFGNFSDSVCECKQLVFIYLGCRSRNLFLLIPYNDNSNLHVLFIYLTNQRHAVTCIILCKFPCLVKCFNMFNM